MNGLANRFWPSQPLRRWWRHFAGRNVGVLEYVFQPGRWNPNSSKDKEMCSDEPALQFSMASTIFSHALGLTIGWPSPAKRRSMHGLNEEATWPSDLLAHLEGQHDLYKAWEEQRLGLTPTKVSGAEYDRALTELRSVLNSHTLHGYHCARLTLPEIDHIRSTGMQLPNEAMLRQRIEAVRDAKLIDSETAAQFIGKNQAGEANRADKIWFCFFPPHVAGESGIESLLRYWGGEALYNSHPRAYPCATRGTMSGRGQCADRKFTWAELS